MSEPYVVDLDKGAGSMRTFTALASETSDPSRTRPDGDIYEVEDEEDLPDAAKSGRTLMLVSEEDDAEFPVHVWVVNSDDGRHTGLSDKSELPKGRGMLFDWEEHSIHGLVMRDMDFAVDMVFLDEDGRVQKIVQNAEPSEETSHSAFCRYSIELPAGTAKENGITEDGTWRAYMDKRRVYVQDPSEAPDWANVRQGQQGGYYYDSSDKPDSSRDRDQNEGQLEDIEIESDFSLQPDQKRLRHNSRRDLANEISEKAGEIGVKRIETLSKSWKGSSYSPEAQNRERAFKQALDIREKYRNGELGDEQPDEETVEAAKYYAKASRKFVRQEYGDEFDLYRGVSESAFQEAVLGFFRDGGVNAQMNAMDNFTGDASLADMFASKYNGAVVENSTTPEDVVVATDALIDQGGMYEEEISLRGDSVDITADEVMVAYSTHDGFDGISLRETAEKPLEAFDDPGSLGGVLERLAEVGKGMEEPSELLNLFEYVAENAPDEFGADGETLAEGVMGMAEEIKGGG